jgi:hypothetical protein
MTKYTYQVASCSYDARQMELATSAYVSPPFAAVVDELAGSQFFKDSIEVSVCMDGPLTANVNLCSARENYVQIRFKLPGERFAKEGLELADLVVDAAVEVFKARLSQLVELREALRILKNCEPTDVKI